MNKGIPLLLAAIFSIAGPISIFAEDLLPTAPVALVVSVVSNYAKIDARSPQEVINNFTIFHGLTEKLKEYDVSRLEIDEVQRVGLSSLYDDVGFFYKQMGEFTNALGNFSRAVQVHPRNIRAYRNTAATYLKWGMQLSESGKDGREKFQLSYDMYLKVYGMTKDEKIKAMADKLKAAYLP
jgi:hypothetical protein